MGFVNDLTYKSLNFSFVLDWQQGGNVIDLTTFLYDDGSNYKDFGTPEWETRYNCYAAGRHDLLHGRRDLPQDPGSEPGYRAAAGASSTRSAWAPRPSG